MRPDVLVAVPTRGAVQAATVSRLQEVRDLEGTPPILYQPGHLSVAAVRNRIVERFLAGDWRTLVMVDDDVVPSPGFLRVCDLLDGYAMVGLPVLTHGPAGLAYAVFGRTGYASRPGPGVHECEAVGTGCVAITRDALERVGERPFEVGFEDGQDVSDDVGFCRRLRELDLRVGAWWDEFADHHARVSLAAVNNPALASGRREPTLGGIR